jgi:hypothetical protein
VVYAMVERLKDLIHSVVTQDRVYWLCFVLLCVLVLFQLYLFIALRIYVSLLRSVISQNQKHGFGITLKYGWHGVETTAVPQNLPPKGKVCNRKKGRLSSKRRVTLLKALRNRRRKAAFSS